MRLCLALTTSSSHPHFCWRSWCISNFEKWPFPQRASGEGSFIWVVLHWFLIKDGIQDPVWILTPHFKWSTSLCWRRQHELWCQAITGVAAAEKHEKLYLLCQHLVTCYSSTSSGGPALSVSGSRLPFPLCMFYFIPLFYGEIQK